jgi:galactokinase
VQEAVALLRAGDLAALGPLLAAGHASLRDDFEVSCPELDLAVGAAIEAGALAARMTGGGFGGSVVAIVATGLVDDVTARCAERAATAGGPVPVVREVTLSAGARRTS